MHAGHRLGDRDRLESCEEVLDERPPPGPARAACSVDAVQQLADRDHADRALFVADERLDRGTLALVSDE
jgi:hypothetical protein